uniref:Solute carrier family 15 member 2 n=1 Tax=Romanomermis culicivorax TaxID=13658 RepID=A0A915IWH9_ROMCU
MPQFVLITVGELLFSISGLEFSYSQASPSMKSVLQAIWLLTVAAGNVLDMIISGTHLFRPATEFFVYASLMVVVISIFTFLAYR